MNVVFSVHSHWECVERILPALREIAWTHCNQIQETSYVSQNTFSHTNIFLAQVNDKIQRFNIFPVNYYFLCISFLPFYFYTKAPMGASYTFCRSVTSSRVKTAKRMRMCFAWSSINQGWMSSVSLWVLYVWVLPSYLSTKTLRSDVIIHAVQISTIHYKAMVRYVLYFNQL